MSAVVNGPWPSCPFYRDPAQAEFFEARGQDDERLVVQATIEGTKFIWEQYRKRHGCPFVLLMMDGNPAPQRVGFEDAETILRAAMSQRTFVYSYKSRRAWRPIWFPSTPLDKRDICNVSHESVILMGWKSFIEGWERRPRAKLFAND